MANEREPERQVQRVEPANIEWVAPEVDIYETEETLVVVADIPGVSEPDVRVDGNELTIEARSEYAEPEGVSRPAAEFGPKNFRRVFALPADIDTAGIRASVSDGVLRVELPKSEAARVHKVPIKAE